MTAPIPALGGSRLAATMAALQDTCKVMQPPHQCPTSSLALLRSAQGLSSGVDQGGYVVCVWPAQQVQCSCSLTHA